MQRKRQSKKKAVSGSRAKESKLMKSACIETSCLHWDTTLEMSWVKRMLSSCSTKFRFRCSSLTGAFQLSCKTRKLDKETKHQHTQTEGYSRNNRSRVEKSTESTQGRGAQSKDGNCLFVHRPFPLWIVRLLGQILIIARLLDNKTRNIIHVVQVRTSEILQLAWSVEQTDAKVKSKLCKVCVLPSLRWNCLPRWR
jgi:hypothetical protein